jgi:hypothetical protein
MARLGKRLLSAFIETGEEPKKQVPEEADPKKNEDTTLKAGAAGLGSGAADQRFTDYFDKLFTDANIPGPDYYEFSKMIGAMQLISDEQSRYYAAYVGLQVQGLDKQKLLSTAAEYLRVLTADADQFQKTVEGALQEKVHNRMAAVEEKGRRIQALSREILQLQEEIGAMQREIGENKEKLEASSNAWLTECGRRKRQIEADIQKINHYIH